MASIAELTQARDTLNELVAARGQQLDILSDALEQLLQAGASDYIVDQVMSLIEYVDAGENVVADVPVIVEPSETVADIPDEPVSVRQQVIAELRSQGYQGAGFDALVRKYHAHVAEREWERAEDDCRGHMIAPAYRGDYMVTVNVKGDDGKYTTHKEKRTGYDTRNFWFCNERELRKYASEELLEWFDRNGRLTFQALRDSLLGQKHFVAGYYNMR